ncbi:MAG TPA: shikimate kinase, partial [Ilumatobacteraceae bacterium]|nr:shikimate kinase [Ilumatobacteraceae bacterium]
MTTSPAAHIVLVGLMGSGKSTVARRIGARLGRPVLDSDEMIEELTGKSVRQIFAEQGEPAFREQEQAVLADALANEEPSVIAAAGGVVLSAANRRLLADADAVVVWLRADPVLLQQR